MGRIVILILLLSGSLSFSQTAQARPFQPDSIAQSDLTRSVDYFVDTTQQLTIKTIGQKIFQPARTDILNFGFTPAVVWVRFTLQQPLNQPRDYVLQLTNWYIDEADLYSPQATGGFAVQKSGDLTPLNQHTIKNRYPTFTVRLTSQKPQTFYLRITGTQYINFTLLLWPRALYFDTKLSGDSADFAMGLMAMRLAFHIALLFFLFSDRKFRAYSFFGISICVIFFFSGVMALFCFPIHPTWPTVCFLPPCRSFRLRYHTTSLW